MGFQSRLKAFGWRALWQRLVAFGESAGRFIRHWISDFFAAGCLDSAAALTYMTLFALVPLMTVCFGMFSMAPAFSSMAEQLKSLLFSQFVPRSTAVIQDYLADFSKQAQQLTVVGAVFLAVTAFLMLASTERIFNAIWGVQRARHGLAKILVYWAVLTIGPIFIGGAFAFSTYVATFDFVLKTYHQLGIDPDIIAFFPFLLSAAGLSFVFITVPNCRVSVTNGILGGIVTALSFEVLKWAFTRVVAKSDFTFIYGAFAALPLFLLWLNLLWTLVLAGLVLVRLLDEKRYRPHHGKLANMQVALLCLQLFYERQQQGLSISEQDIATSEIDLIQWNGLRDLLLASGWIVQTQQGDYLLQRQLNQLSLWDLAVTLNMGCGELEATMAAADKTQGPILETFQRQAYLLKQVSHEQWRITLAELFQAPLEAPESP